LAFLSALVAGLLFGAGLLVSGMSDPQRVLGFLDVAGAWNPALAFTMAGAIAVGAPAWWYVRRGGVGFGGRAVTLPDRFRIDRALIGGSALFGVGWGLSGICPGPSLLLLTSASREAIVFVVAMIVGFFVARRVPGISGRDRDAATGPGASSGSARDAAA
jgi:uncharacterized membrane protein YedE/YeeE